MSFAFLTFVKFRYFRENGNAVLVLEGNVFVHAGLKPSFVQLGIRHMNELVQRLLQGK